MALCTEVGSCREWVGTYTTNGYPIVHIIGVGYVPVRRLVVTLKRDLPLDQKLTVRCGGIDKPAKLVPICGNGRCVEHSHIRLLSAAAIARLAARKGRFSTASRIAAVTRGIRAKRKNLKVDTEKAREIRAADGTYNELAARFGISRAMVGRIKRGELWREMAPNASVFHMLA
jgi:hypothetical protein